MKSILKNKRAQIGENMMIAIIIFFVVMIVMGMIIWMFSTLTTTLVDTDADDINISGAASDTFGQVNASLIGSANVIAFSIMIGMVLAMLIVEFLTRRHPAFFFLDVLVLIMAFIISVFLSNRYEELLNGLPFTNELINMRAGTSIMLHLPRWVTVVGLIGMALSYISIKLRGSGEDFQ